MSGSLYKYFEYESVLQQRFIKFFVQSIILIAIISGCGINETKAGTIRKADADGMAMLFIPAGEFWMGTTHDDIHADKDEIPRHKVYLEAYWIDKTEITNAMYNQCISVGNCTSPTRSRNFSNLDYETHPVIGVSWERSSSQQRCIGCTLRW